MNVWTLTIRFDLDDDGRGELAYELNGNVRGMEVMGALEDVKLRMWARAHELVTETGPWAEEDD